MSDKTELDVECKSEASFLDVTKNSTILVNERGTSTPIAASRPSLALSRGNSSILLSERGTSTPIGPNRLSFSRLDAHDYVRGFAKIRRDTRAKPKMNDSSVPIFGRKNLQLLSDCRKSGDESGVKRILQKHNVRQHPVNVEKTFEDSSSVAQPSSSAFPKKENNRKNAVNKRRSAHNESKVPIFKVVPKLPKSPRLLTAMRAKLRANREKAKNMQELMKEDERKKKQEDCPKPMRPAQKKPPPTVFNKFRITVPISPKIKQTKKSPWKF